MAKTYTVKWGDTLSQIARDYNTTVNALVKLNNIADPDFIVVGQVLVISGEKQAVKTSTSNKASITTFGVQSGTDRTFYAAWTWDKSNTENYQVEWQYDTGDGVWFNGNITTETYRQSTYNGPDNAKRIRFRVKPVSKKRTVNNRETSYWTASWSDFRYYSYSSLPPKTPPIPTINIDKSQLKITMENLGNLNAERIYFQIAKDGAIYKSSSATINSTNGINWVGPIAYSSNYKVRARSGKSGEYSSWSEWSGEKASAPSAPSEVTHCTIGTINGVLTLVVWWNKVTTATKYTVQYTNLRTDFTNDTPQNLKSVTVNKIFANITDGIEDDKEYFVRIRAENDAGDVSEWSSIITTSSGDGPAAPTTWSSVSTVTVGEPLTLFWTHNSEGTSLTSSKITYADLETFIDDVLVVAPIFDYTKDDDSNETGNTRSYNFDTSGYTDGAVLRWRARTAGSAKIVGAWSALRRVDIYAQPELEMIITSNNTNYSSNIDSDNGFTLSSLPIKIQLEAGPESTSQKPIGYTISIIANEGYETVDNFGNAMYVNENDVVYSEFYDSIDKSNPNVFKMELSAGELRLSSGISYTIKAEVNMSSGLTKEATLEFLTSWTASSYTVNAEIGIDYDDFSASIRPYCEDSLGHRKSGVLLYVYRREYDGSFTKIAGDIDNTSNTYVTDPHPSLDYARYRIVAIDETGAIQYNDLSGHYVGCKSVVIQWDEAWVDFDITDEKINEPTWTGSMIKLPYNIDISERKEPDIVHVKYIGREHPVSYYGTQLGETLSLNVDIDKRDKDTIFALRRLQRWMGDVYVREPSGIGYWATVSASFNLKHRSVVVPVSIDIARVEGGA